METTKDDVEVLLELRDSKVSRGMVSKMKMNGILRLSQLQEMYESGDYSALCNIRNIGKSKAETIVLAASEFKLIPTEKKEYEKEDGKIDIEKFSENIVEEKDLVNTMLDVIFDCAYEEKDQIGGFIYDHVEDITRKIGGVDVIYNKKTLYIEYSFLKKKFEEATKDLILAGEHERDRYKYLNIALKNCSAVETSRKGNDIFHYTRRPFLGTNCNYVAINIKMAEEIINRSLKFNLTNEIDFVKYIDTVDNRPEKRPEKKFTPKPVETTNQYVKSDSVDLSVYEKVVVEKREYANTFDLNGKKYLIIPKSCQYYTDFSITGYKILKLVVQAITTVCNIFDNYKDATMKETEAYYIFREKNPKNGYVMVTREEFEEPIKKFIQTSLNSLN